MIFLQPYLLWGLPLILIPVIIHLINRLRHRPQPWAAMRFLVSATRSSVGHARLRQFLILLFRVLAVLMLILFLSRPLAGGWLGWILASAPEMIVVLLDRSASMETRIPGSTLSRREQALDLVSQAAREFEDRSHLILIESANRTVHEVAAAADLKGLSLTAPTDTAADLPGMLQTALDWLLENRAGTAEIWICSDLQRTNWKPEDSRWERITAQFAALPQKVRFRLLSFPASTENNASIRLEDLKRIARSDRDELHCLVEVQSNTAGGEPLPLTTTLDGVPSQTALEVDGLSTLWRHRIDLGGKTRGWGAFHIPADANPSDNAVYFTYSVPVPAKALLVSTDPEAGRFLRPAAATVTPDGVEPAREISAAQFRDGIWRDTALMIWQAPIPTNAAAGELQAFLESGGTAIFFPSGQPDAGHFQGLSWGEVQRTEPENAWRISHWDQKDGPLADTEEGLQLPVHQLTIFQRQVVRGGEGVLGSFNDGTPFLVRRKVGRGELLFCASLPHARWSNLQEGPVLVPLLQRLLHAGGDRLQPPFSVACGELGPVHLQKSWTPVDTPTASGSTFKDPQLHAGVYQSGGELLAMNRPALENDPALLEPNEAGLLFENLPFQAFQEETNRTAGLQGEVWRVFLVFMLLFLLLESLLILPSAAQPRSPATSTMAPSAGLPSPNR